MGGRVPNRGDPAEPQGHGGGGRGPSCTSQQGLGCAAAAEGGGGACGEGPSPQLCAWARGRPQAKLWSPGRAGLPTAAGASTLQASTPSYHCWAPQELFQAPGGDSTCLARQGHCPAHRTLSARPPGPASQDDSHPCRAAGHLSAGQPLKALLPQPLQRGVPCARPYGEQAGSRAWGSLVQPHGSPPDTAPKHLLMSASC